MDEKAARRRKLVYIMIVIIGFLGATMYGSRGGSTGPELVPMVVSLDEIPSHTVLTPQIKTTFTRVVMVPADARPPGAFVAPADIPDNSVVTDTLPRGVPLTREALNRVISSGAPPVNGISTNAALLDGMVAYTFNPGDTGSLSQGAQPGDRVDIAVTWKQKVTAPKVVATPGAPAPADETITHTRILFQNVLVLNIGSNFVPDSRSGVKTAPNSPAAASTVTVVMKPEDVVALKFFKDDGAGIDLLLRPVTDRAVRVTSEITNKDADRFFR